METNEDKAQRTMNLIDRAIHRNNLAAIEVQEKATGRPVTVLVEKYDDGKGNFALRPLARLFIGEPFEEVTDPPGAIGTYAASGREALAQAAGEAANSPV